jgi:hypothetical protein
MQPRVSQASCLWECHTRLYVRAIILLVNDLVRTFWRVPYPHIGGIEAQRLLRFARESSSGRP